ncbi:MAG: hypothetical protein AAGF54_04475, partial [Pseudomonadota bacterium]
MGINEVVGEIEARKADTVSVPNTNFNKSKSKLKKKKFQPRSSAIEAGYNGFLSIFMISRTREVLHSSRNSKYLYTRNVIQFDGMGNLELKDRRANDTLIQYLKQIEEEGFKSNAPIVWTDKVSNTKHSCSLIPVEVSAEAHMSPDERRNSNLPFACLVFEELGLNVRLCHVELQENFSLTNAEIDLAEGLFAGKDICQIAEENG